MAASRNERQTNFHENWHAACTRESGRTCVRKRASPLCFSEHRVQIGFPFVRIVPANDAAWSSSRISLCAPRPEEEEKVYKRKRQFTGRVWERGGGRGYAGRSGAEEARRGEEKRLPSPTGLQGWWSTPSLPPHPYSTRRKDARNVSHGAGLTARLLCIEMPATMPREWTGRCKRSAKMK